MRPVNLLDEGLLLWDKFHNGDADAFAELIRVHYQDLFNYGIRIARDEELVKDEIQDLLLSLWKNRATISDTSFVKYYPIFASVNNDYLRCFRINKLNK